MKAAAVILRTGAFAPAWTGFECSRWGPGECCSVWRGYALAAAGEAGVSHMLDLVAAEIRVALSLTGCTRVSDIRDYNLVQNSCQNLGDASLKTKE